MEGCSHDHCNIMPQDMPEENYYSMVYCKCKFMLVFYESHENAHIFIYV